MSDARAIIAKAREAIALATRRGEERGEWDLSWYILRDLEATEMAGLSELAWSGYAHGGTTRGDFEGLVESLEKWIANTEAGEAIADSAWIFDRNPRDEELTESHVGPGMTSFDGTFLTHDYCGAVSAKVFTRYYGLGGVDAVWAYAEADRGVPALRVAAWKPMPSVSLEGFDNQPRLAEDGGLISCSLGRFATGLDETGKHVVRWVDGRRVEWG